MVLLSAVLLMINAAWISMPLIVLRLSAERMHLRLIVLFDLSVVGGARA